MIQSYRQIIGAPVVDHEDGALLALVQDIIVHPDTGKIEAFWVKPLTLPIKNAVIQSNSILEWKKNIYIDGENEITDPEDIIKISEILSRNTYFIGNQVRNEAEDDLGRVYDLDFDTDKLFLRQLYAQKSFLMFKYGERVFAYDKVIKVLPEYILVKDTESVQEPAIAEGKQPLLDV